jgi:hypothetical protein
LPPPPPDLDAGILTQAEGKEKIIKMAAHLLTHIYFFIFFCISSLFFLLWLLFLLSHICEFYSSSFLFFGPLLSVWGSYTGLIAIDALD